MKLKEWIKSNGKVIDLDISYRVLLHDTSSIYYISEGSVDLFILSPLGEASDHDEAFFQELSIQSSCFLGDLIVGPLHFLAHFENDDYLLPFPLDSFTSPYKVIAKANEFTQLLKIPLSKLVEFIDQSDEKETLITSFKNVLENWIIELSKNFYPYLPTENFLYISEGKNAPKSDIRTFLLSKHGTAIHHSILGWAFPIKGEVKFCGEIVYPPLTEGLMMPVTTNTWIDISDSGEFEFYPESVNSITLKEIYESILIFEKVVVVAVKLIEKKELKEELAKIAEKAVLTEKHTEFTIKRVGNILDKKKILNIRDFNNKLFQSFEVIANALEKKLYIPPKISEQSQENQIYSIATASRIYGRDISLNKDWRLHGSLPLLGYQAHETIEPVALITNSEGIYEYVDAANHFEPKIVDKAIEEITLPQAKMYYRSLPEATNLTPFQILSHFSKNNLRDIYIIIGISLLSMLVGVVTPFFNRIIFDVAIPTSDYYLLAQILIWMFLIVIFQMALSYVRTFSFMRFETLFSHNLDMSIWIRLLNVPYSFFRQHSSGDLYSRINAISSLKNIVSSHSVSLTLDAVFSIIYLFVMMYFSLALALITLGVLFLITVVDIIALMISLNYERVTQKVSGDLYGQLMQVIVGISKIKIYGAESRIFNFWADAFIKLLNVSIKEAKLGIWISTINLSLSKLMSYTLMIGMIMIKYFENPMNQKSFTIGEFMAFSSAFSIFSGYYFSVISSLKTYLTIIPTWERCKVIIDEKPEVLDYNLLSTTIRGKVEFKNVFFRYDKDGPYVHKDISFHVEPGEFIAIVGRSGCGKSSLIQLLLGFEKPELGAILIDDKELSSFDIQKVRSQIGVVSQSCKPIDGSIRDNITGGKICTTEEVMNAAKIAEFESVIKELPMGLQTHLSHGSDTLSGGQMQRLYIARSIIGVGKEKKLLIFDEATNALDNKTQRAVIEHIDKLHVTRIVIAHRLSTITKADRIYVMKEGRIVETGTYDQLIEQNGYFKRLVDLQSL